MSFTDTLQIDMGVLIDQISVMMLIVVSTVSFLVHLYSRGYMKGDTGYTKFFAFLSLFTFSMMGLVMAANLFQIYIFWELVGVSSYLLIGYYYTKPSAVLAAKKAFIVTRFADLGFLVGILILGYYTGTFDFMELTDPDGAAITNWASTSFMGLSVLTWGLMLIFIGGAGKSAMFPLHIWLPDAMEGPTPVSALIHAATMVVAGVFLVARLFPMYYFVEDGFALNLVAWVGAFSALFAAIIALTQNDIKRVLAFSTMSQIGYMMLALGVSEYEGHNGLGYMASMFHLFTHAMFKALLFLAAGSIIHAVHSNYLKDMGGLRKYMPITHITFLIAALSISGFPGFAGFFSKDEILVAAYEHNKLIYYIGIFVAGLTAFYMFRLYFGIFWKKDTKYKHIPHESPASMTIPLIILAFMSIAAGYIHFSEYVTADHQSFEAHLNYPLAAIAVAVGFIGGAEMLGGLLAGVTTCGVLMAIFQSNAGGAWDNAKKTIEEQGKKGTEAHKAAVVGDTVGDPFKDTSGPSLNILLKLMSVVALVIAPSIALNVEEVTAHNMKSLTITEQVVVAETAEGTVVTDETTITLEEANSEELKVVAEEVITAENIEKK